MKIATCLIQNIELYENHRYLNQKNQKFSKCSCVDTLLVRHYVKFQHHCHELQFYPTHNFPNSGIQNLNSHTFILFSFINILNYKFYTRRISTNVALASIEFSINSFTTDETDVITWVLLISLIVSDDNCFMDDMINVYIICIEKNRLKSFF